MMPTTEAGRGWFDDGGEPYYAVLVPEDVIDIEREARQQVLTALWSAADLQAHYAMDHDGDFADCDRPACAGLLWLFGCVDIENTEDDTE